MAFKELSGKRYAGFFNYEENNVIRGTIAEENITGTTESGNETGYIAIKVDEPCKAKLDEAEFVAQPGDVIALSITNATRVLIGLKQDTLVRCTFLGFKPNKRNPAKKYHSWRIEVDEEPSAV
jgi:hypothetical protein